MNKTSSPRNWNVLAPQFPSHLQSWSRPHITMHLQIALTLVQHYTFRLLLSTVISMIQFQLVSNQSPIIGAITLGFGSRTHPKIHSDQVWQIDCGSRLLLCSWVALETFSTERPPSRAEDVSTFSILVSRVKNLSLCQFANVIPFRSSFAQISWNCCGSHRHLPNIQPKVWHCDAWISLWDGYGRADYLVYRMEYVISCEITMFSMASFVSTLLAVTG